MDDTELEDAIDKLILNSGLPLEEVAGVLEAMTYRYKEQVANEAAD